MDLKTIRLIAIGDVPAVEVSELKPGDTLMWNYGTKCEVISCETANGRTYELVTKYPDGTEYFQRKRGTTLVCRVPDSKA